MRVISELNRPISDWPWLSISLASRTEHPFLGFALPLKCPLSTASFFPANLLMRAAAESEEACESLVSSSSLN